MNKQKKDMIISIDKENAFDKVQHLSIITIIVINTQKTRNRGKISQCDKWYLQESHC